MRGQFWACKMGPFLAPKSGVLGQFLGAETGQFLDTKVGSFWYRFWIHVLPPEFGSGLIPGRQHSPGLGGELGPCLGIRSFVGPAKCTLVVHFWVPKFRLCCLFGCQTSIVLFWCRVCNLPSGGHGRLSICSLCFGLLPPKVSDEGRLHAYHGQTAPEMQMPPLT